METKKRGRYKAPSLATLPPEEAEAMRKWYRRIGAKGGQAGKGTEIRRELMRKNIAKRWRMEKERKAKEAAELAKLLAGAAIPEVGFK